MEQFELLKATDSAKIAALEQENYKLYQRVTNYLQTQTLMEEKTLELRVQQKEKMQLVDVLRQENFDTKKEIEKED